MKFDDIDIKIIDILSENSKMSFKEIGEKLHMTGQAVGARVNKLVQEEVIKNFTVNIDKSKIDNINVSLIKVYMTTPDHTRIKKIISKRYEITEALRVAGDGCYILRVECPSNDVLNEIIDEINIFANYQVSSVIAKIK